jgi:hypothetical protein
MFEMVEGTSTNSDKSHRRNTSILRRESTALHDSKLIEALRRSKLYRDYERTFSEVTGLPLALRPVEFFGLPFQGKKNENEFCAFLADCKSSCSLCLQTQSRVAENAGNYPRSIQCPLGLTETAFRDLAKAAEWLAIPVDVLSLKDEPVPHIGPTARKRS